jgi:hypothetical protein
VVTPPERVSRIALRTQKIQESKNQLEEFLSLPGRQQSGVMQKLVQQKRLERLTRKANRETAVSDAATQDQGILGNMPRPAIVARLLSSAEVKKWGHLFPRAGDFDVLSESSQSNIVEVMTSIAIGVARKLLPMDAEQGAGALLKQMTDNTTFKRFALPNIAVDSSSGESYVQFTQNPVY